MQDRLAAQGASWTVTIPKSIANGEYLLRHEILGLHVAGTVGGAQVRAPLPIAESRLT